MARQTEPVLAFLVHDAVGNLVAGILLATGTALWRWALRRRERGPARGRSAARGMTHPP
ncbi:hypothetical protein HUF15_39110 [Streptomyces samsunensis]|uniref:hypothetical protein n=1 Tax=Streptomyces TaxID=1883 RepID=UPI001301BB57|nr:MULTISPECIES: hypothetical protein [Streptomyces]MCQ6247003.1 hypothetical protein [Streptomyces malaysiensis]NUH42655.1 hypothetical protein [Streptomyces samsunensis]